MDKFCELGVEVVGVFIDLQFIYYVWCSMLVEKGGIGVVEFIMVVDVKYEIICVYGIEYEDGVVLCVLFLIDCVGVVQY